MKINYIKRRLCLYLLLACICNLSAQKEANWWYFGYNAGLNFNILSKATPTSGGVVSDMPKAVGGPLYTQEGCFTISDSNGNLQLSGDGSSIWNRNSFIMPYATNLGGGSSSAQSGIIIPVPGSITRYYTISVAAQQGKEGIQYAIVDMTLNGGLGGIETAGGSLVKNKVLLVGPTDENIACIRKSNSANYWLIHRRQNKTTGVTMHVWEVTPTGITKHLTQTFNYSLDYSASHLSVLKFSSDGKRFVSPNYQGKGLIFGEFDPATGIPSNLGFTSTPAALRTYGAEFSPNGELVYFNYSESPGDVFQIPWASVKANSLADMVKLPFQVSNFQLAPDGRIYAISYLSKNLYVILEPDKPGLSCDMRQFTDYLTSNAVYGLPSFIASFFALEAKKKAFVCKGNSFNYKVEVSFIGSINDYPIRLEWNWGDGSVIENQDIVSDQTQYSMPHSYTAANDYNVTITPYKAGNVALSSITLEANVVNCMLQVNRQIRINVDNASTQLVKQ